MQLNKEGIQIRKILELFIDKDVLTVDEIASKISLSEKTVRTRLIHLDEYLQEEELGSITRKPRVGVWLNINEGKIQKIYDLINSNSKDEVYQSDDRLNRLISIFLSNPNESYTLNQLSNMMYYSVPTVSNTIDEATEWFLKNKIKLRRVTNRGHWIEFDEYDYRVACRNYIKESSERVDIKEIINSLFPFVDVDMVKTLILTTETSYGLHLTDTAFIDLLIFTCIKIFRNSKGYYVDNINTDKLTKYKEYGFVELITKSLSTDFQYEFCKHEVSVLAFQILFNFSLLEKDNILTDEKIDNLRLSNLVERMIETISEIISVDLTKDKLLKEGLVLHLKPALLRMEYGYYDNNAEVSEIRELYSSTYKAVWSISMLLENEYDIQMNDNEVAYISLYIQAAIERNQQPLNVLFVSSKPNAQNQYLIQQLRKNVIGDSNLKTISLHHVNKYDLDNYDVVLSTDKSETFSKYNNVLVVGTIVSEVAFRNMNSFINKKITLYDSKRKKDIRCNNLFDEELIIVGKKFNNKEEVIKYASNKLVKKGLVTEKYYQTVIDRENIADTCIGNGVAIPHGSQDEVIKPSITVLVLKNPIQWNNNEKVSVVYLLSLSMKSDSDQLITTIFYKDYLNSLSEESSVKEIQSLNSSKEILEYIKK